MGTNVRTVTKIYCFVQRRVFIMIKHKVQVDDFDEHCLIFLYFDIHNIVTTLHFVTLCREMHW